MAKLHALRHFGPHYARMHEADGNALIFQVKKRRSLPTMFSAVVLARWPYLPPPSILCRTVMLLLSLETSITLLPVRRRMAAVRAETMSVGAMADVLYKVTCAS